MVTERAGFEESLRRPNDDIILRKAAQMATKNIETFRKAPVRSSFWAHIHNLETCPQEGDQAGIYEHLKATNVEGKRDRSS